MAIADLVSTLARHDVEFIIVGGMAAILRGTPVNTFDLDIFYERSAENIERLLNALKELQAVVRDDPRRKRLNKSHLESAGHKLMETNQGPLDLLGTIEETTGFPELITDSDWIDLGVTRARVLKLERLIQIKQRLGRPKDQAMLPLLLATLDETKRSK
jgi:predicted nucleotidyltransferase